MFVGYLGLTLIYSENEASYIEFNLQMKSEVGLGSQAYYYCRSEEVDKIPF